jgi:hypothetical protein
MTKRKKRVLLIIAVVLAAYLLYAYLPLGKPELVVSPETTYVTGPLRPDGTVDYVAYLNAQQAEGVTPENNAAVLLVDALGPDWLCSIYPPDEQKEQAYITNALKLLNHTPADGPYYVSSDDWAEAEGVDDPLDPSDDTYDGDLDDSDDDDPEAATLDTAWQAEDYPAVAAWLADQEQPLDLIVEASRREACFVPLLGDSLDEIQFPGLNLLRTVAKALCRRALLRAGQGDPQGAVEDILAVHRLAQLTVEPFLINRLVSIASENLASHTAEVVIASDTLDAASAKRCAAQLAALPDLPDVASCINASERMFTLSYLQQAYRKGVFADLTFGLDEDQEEPLTTKNVDISELMRLANAYYDGMVADIRGKSIEGYPVYVRIREADIDSDALHSKLTWSGYLGRVAKGYRTRLLADALLDSSFLSFNRARELGMRAFVARDVAASAAAVVAFQKTEDNYPASLGDLVPEYLPAVPDDRYGNGPLKYRREDGGAVVWSIGEDGKDDGGVPQWDVETDYDYRGDRSIRLGSARPLRLRVGQSATDPRVLAMLQYIEDDYFLEAFQAPGESFISLEGPWRLYVTLDADKTITALAVSKMPEHPRRAGMRPGPPGMEPGMGPDAPPIPREAAQAVTVNIDRELVSYETPEGEKRLIAEDD